MCLAEGSVLENVLRRPEKVRKLRAFWASKAEAMPEKRLFRQVTFLPRPEKACKLRAFCASKAEAVPEKGLSNK